MNAFGTDFSTLFENYKKEKPKTKHDYMLKELNHLVEMVNDDYELERDLAYWHEIHRHKEEKND